MTSHATIEELEALSRGELETARTAAIDAHLAECATCQSELAWLRAERSLLSRRPRAVLPPALWRNIEAQIAKPALAQPVTSARKSRPRSQAAQWYAVAAAAGAILITMSLGGVSFAWLGHGLVALFSHAPAGGKTSMATLGSMHVQIDDDGPPIVATTPISAPVTLRVQTLSADIEAVAGPREQLRIEVTESKRQSVELRSEGPNELRAYFDGLPRLEHGHLRLLLPPGTRLEVATVSGSLHESGVGGDVRLQTASGDVRIDDARRLDIDTASGDMELRNFSGPARINTASGDARVFRGSAPLAGFDFHGASGELELDGLCAKDCRLTIESVSGDVKLHTGAGSSYTARFHTVSGDLDGVPGSSGPHHGDDDDDALGVPPKERTFRRGDGLGQISVNTVSGDLEIGPN